MNGTSRIARLRVSEIFGPTIQGEGNLIGIPTLFLRLAGCDYRCSWCDSMYAVDPSFRDQWESLSDQEVLLRLLQLSHRPILVTISGGNPALQDLAPLITCGKQKGLSFALETQGSVAKPWFKLLDYITLSPKGPSSGQLTRTESITKCLEATDGMAAPCLKVVVFSRADLDYGARLHEQYPTVPFVLQVGTPQGRSFDVNKALDSYRELVNLSLALGLNEVRILPQMHTYLWGHERAV